VSPAAAPPSRRLDLGASIPLGVTPRRQLGRGRGFGRRLREHAIEGLLFACGLLSVFTTLGIVGVLVFETFEFFGEVPLWRFLTDTEWTPLFADKHFGILVLASATLLTSAIALVVAVPIGLMSAIYLSEFATPSVRKVVKPLLEVLAGVPTVVYGYFALLFVTPILQWLFPWTSGFNALSAGLVMGVMIIPLVVSLSEDAMFAVPRSLRDGAYALGATRYEAATRVVVPAALSGIVASFILAISRAVGETMIVAIAAGQSPRLTLNPFVPVETMTAYIVQVSLGDTPTGTLEFKTIFAVGMTLFLSTLLLNMLSHRLVVRFRERYE
jgi:phosphate transport system permease protein